MDPVVAATADVEIAKEGGRALPPSRVMSIEIVSHGLKPTHFARLPQLVFKTPLLVDLSGFFDFHFP